MTSAIPPLIVKGNIQGKKAITGLVWGYDIVLRIGRTAQPSHARLVFHAIATSGIFGAAVVVSKMLNLSEFKISHSLGIATNSVSGLL